MPCRALAAGGVALGSKVAMMAKAGGGASGVFKGIAALTAAGSCFEFDTGKWAVMTALKFHMCFACFVTDVTH